MMQGSIGVSSRGVDVLALHMESIEVQRRRFGLRSVLALLAGAGFAIYLCYLALRPEPDASRHGGDVARDGIPAQR